MWELISERGGTDVCYRARAWGPERLMEKRAGEEGRVAVQEQREGKGRVRLADPRGHVGLGSRRPSIGGGQGWNWGAMLETRSQRHSGKIQCSSCETPSLYVLFRRRWVRGSEHWQHPRERTFHQVPFYLTLEVTFSDSQILPALVSQRNWRLGAPWLLRGGQKVQLRDCSLISHLFPTAHRDGIQLWLLLSPLGQPEASLSLLQQRFPNRRTFKNSHDLVQDVSWAFACFPFSSFVETK